MNTRVIRRKSWGVGVLVSLTALAMFAHLSPKADGAQKQTLTLAQHLVPAIKKARLLGRANQSQKIPLTIALTTRNTEELDALLRRLYDPRDTLFGQYLTTEEYTANYAVSEEEYQEVLAFAKSKGLEVTNTTSNRLLLNLKGSVSTIEKAFGVHINTYQTANGRQFYANDTNPVIPSSLQNKIAGIVGLDNYAVHRTHTVKRPSQSVGKVKAHGSGQGGGLTPSDIAAAYGLKGLTQNGAGQTLAVFELDGYYPADISTYLSNFNLPSVPLKNILVSGADGTPGGSSDSVAQDIELQLAVASGATSVLVYEGPNSTTGVLDTYNRIATDNLAKQISTSWGIDEGSTTATILNIENSIFKQMAAQGQSLFAASGNYGAYDDGATLSVDDPASQPYVTGVGGTSLTTAANGNYVSETAWGDTNFGMGSGGGISSFWSIPNYQSGAISTASKGSTTRRNVPDVSLNADPNKGYSVFAGGQWQVLGGTGSAAAIWAGYTAIVNQQRAANSLQPLGFANNLLYATARRSTYKTDFNDILDGSTNFFYPAVKGYDNATGWGSLVGSKLLNDLAGTARIAAPTNLKATANAGTISLSWNASAGASRYSIYRSYAQGKETLYWFDVTSNSFTDTNVVPGTTYYYKVTASALASESPFSNEASTTPLGTVNQLLNNPGFENAPDNTPWVVSAGVIGSSTQQPARSGKWRAWLCGYGATHTDTLMQQVAIPSTAVATSLTFWLHVDSAELLTSGAKDTLKVQIRDANGTVLETLATYSNLDAAGGYAIKGFDLQSYIGKTIQIYLVGSEVGTRQTSFVVDDFALRIK